MIAVIDYGAGNLGSVVNAVARIGYEFEITSKPAKILEARAVVLPGVGAAGDCMQKLVETGVSDVISKLVAEDRPILAICVGLQVLLTGTEEGGWHKCMNLIPGRVKRLPAGLKIPHMGWNQVKQEIKHPIFDGIPDKTNFYFVHSYYADPDDKSMVASTTEYGIPFCSMVIKNSLVATQFHPEKSSSMGLKMYSNFFELALKGHK